MSSQDELPPLSRAEMCYVDPVSQYLQLYIIVAKLRKTT